MNFFKKFKPNKVIAALLGVAMTFNVTPFVAQAEDLGSHWAKSTIDDFVSRGVLKGYEDGTVRPDNPVTRAEMFAFTNRDRGYALGDSTNVNFSDVRSSDWFYNDVAIAVSEKYAFGDEGGTMRPNSNITRQEAAVIIARILGVEGNVSAANTFSDSSEMADYAKGQIGALASAKVISGYPDGSFRPKANITRAEAMTMLKNIGGQKGDTVIVRQGQVFEGTAAQVKVVNNLTVAGKDAVVRHVLVKGNLVIAEGVGNGEATLENVTVEGGTFVYGGGVNSIHAKNSKLNHVEMNSKNYGTRLVLEGTSTTAAVSFLASGILELKDTAKVTGDTVLEVNMRKDSVATLMGKFDKVILKAPNVKLEFPSGTVVDTLNVESTATGSTIDVQTGATINNVRVEAKVSFTGQGTIKSMLILVDGVTMERFPLAFAKGSKTATLVKAASGSGGGGGGGGGSDGGGGSPSTTVAVTSVTITNPPATLLLINETMNLSTTIQPATATNKKVTWSSSDETIATVDSSGNVTGKKMGKTTITVKTDDGAKTDSCDVFVSYSKLYYFEIDENAPAKVGEVVMYVKVIGVDDDATAALYTVTYDGNRLRWSSVSGKFVGNVPEGLSDDVHNSKIQVLPPVPEVPIDETSKINVQESDVDDALATFKGIETTLFVKLNGVDTDDAAKQYKVMYGTVELKWESVSKKYIGDVLKLDGNVDKTVYLAKVTVTP